MAFDLQKLENHGGSGGGLKLWSYNGSDTATATKASGFFNEASDLLSVGDRILCHATDADFDCHVSAISSGVVTVAAIDSFS